MELLKIRTVLLLLLSISFSFASSVNITTGWNLMGGVSNNDVNLSKFSISWVYSDGKWSHSRDEGFSIDPQQGVWFLYKDEKPYSYIKKENEHSNLVLKKGWNLVGDIDKKFNLHHESIAYIFGYGVDGWIINPDIETIESKNGYWVFALKETTLHSVNPLLAPPDFGVDNNSLKDSFYISDNDLNRLSLSEKRSAVDKILSAFFVGFDKSKMDNLINTDKTISTLMSIIEESNPSKLQETEIKLDLYSYHWRDKVAARSLGRLFLLPLSKEYLDMWTAYQLVNSKFYSGSLELNTVEDGTAVNLMQTLYQQIATDTPIATMLYNYLNSEEHWRRFRSPEDNTREVLELQMDLFDDSLIPLASLTCQNYAYNEREKNLIIGFNYNYTPVNMFSQTIYTCDQFYKTTAKQDEVITTFINYFVDQYFPLWTQNEKNSFVKEIEDLKLTTYKDILFSIIFSDKYVNESSKIKSIEELFLSNSKKIDFIPSLYTFRSFVETAYNSGQSIMYHKLGRGSSIPSDILSYSTLSKKFRETILMDIKHNMFNEKDAGWSSEFMNSLDFSSKKDLINSLYFHMLNTQADNDEIETFEIIFDKYNIDSDYHRSVMVLILLDYISQLPQTYITSKIVQN